MPPKLGIIAGGGDLPGRLVEACRRQGRPHFVLALEGHADKSRLGDAPQTWLRIGAAGSGFRILHEQGVAEVVMAGPVRRPTLGELRPDWRTARFFARLGTRAIGDDTLLRSLIAEFEGEGFAVVGIEDILGDEVLASKDVWGRHAPDDEAWSDIRRGCEVAFGLGALDVGQSVVVQQGIVLGVEAVEGTDALLHRCASLKRQGLGGVLVKMRKPEQDQRADLPTIGPTTVQNAHAAGIRGIAVQAGATLVVGPDEVTAKADELGLFIVGIEPTDASGD